MKPRLFWQVISLEARTRRAEVAQEAPVLVEATDAVGRRRNRPVVAVQGAPVDCETAGVRLGVLIRERRRS